MKNQTALRRTGAAIVVASVLVVSGCGSKEESKPAATSAPSSSSAAKSSAAPSSQSSAAPSSSSSASSASKAESSSQSKPAAAAPVPGGLPQAPVKSNVEPAAQGRPGTPEEIQAITERVKKQESATTIHQYINTFVDSMCTEVLNQQGGAAAFNLAGIPDAPLTVMPDYAATATKVTDVTNVLVEGDRATASITTVTGAGESATNTMAFRNEQGTWKICS
ncbi:hypothetical protein [Corynebacterium sp. H130]|uniref:hypothetical protein n=1 Tax=Corynebacterium sp. H130 TaxID=3133444 RepID=UPI0030B2084D